MDNQNKNPQATQGNKKKDNNRKKNHKPKSYFINPNDAQNVKPEIKEVKPSSEKQTVAPQPVTEQIKTIQNNNNGKNPNNRNKKKHKKNNDRPRDITQQKNEAQSKDPQNKSTPAPSSRSDRLDIKKSDSLSAVAEQQKYADYEEFTYEEIYGDKDQAPLSSANEVTSTDNSQNQPLDQSDKKIEVVGIKFKESGKTYYFAPAGFSLHVGQHAVVKTSRGLEYGEVAVANTMVNESETVPPLRSVARVATPVDVKHYEENKQKETEAFRICNEKIISHKLDMKLIDAQYTFDNSKLLFYFTSSGRVDFRDLVKDLAAVFRTRIELRQIGIRDEAKMIGGLGMCGRPLCCSMFLTDFGQVSIKMAKEQNLSLNSAKISGNCGRLMCCLRYEQDTYDYEIKHTPPVDTVVKTVDGIGTVCEISPLTGTIKVRLSAQPEVPPKSYKREDVKILKKKQ